MRLLILPCALLVPLSLACSRQAPDPSAAQVKEPDDPLADKVRALSAGQVMVERISSKPVEGEVAEYEWAILARISLSDVPIPSQFLAGGTRPSGLDGPLCESRFTSNSRSNSMTRLVEHRESVFPNRANGISQSELPARVRIGCPAFILDTAAVAAW